MIKNIVATVGEYTNKNWETKKQYLTIWKLIDKDGKFSVKIDSIPVWWNWWAWVYDIEKKWETETQKIVWNVDLDLPF